MTFIVIFFTSLLITIFFTPYLIEYFIKFRIIDKPGEERSVNKVIVPRMGGLIIYLIALTSIISFYSDLNSIRYFVIASVIIVSLGVIDDIVGVAWDKKFIVQFIAAIFLVYYLSPSFSKIEFFGIHPPFPYDYLILILLIVGVINSINLLDGLDGLASGFSLLVVFITFLIGLNLNNKLLLILSSSLMGSLIGFLKFNAYPAKIFLGDSGSLSLGFFLITASLISSIDIGRKNLDITFTVILLAVPVVDTIKVMIVRLFNKKNPFLPDKNHIHYIIYGNQVRHKVTVFILQGFSLLFAAISLYYLRGSKLMGVIFFIVLSIPLLFMNKILIKYRQIENPLRFRKLYNKVPQVIIIIFRKYILPVLSVISLTILIGLTPIRSNISHLFISLSILFIALLLIYSLLNYQRNKYINDILVFFNLILFLLYSNYSERIYNILSFYNFINIRLTDLLIFIVLPIIVFFLFFRERILGKKVSFLTGIDLIILVFIVLLSVSSNLFPTTQITSINLILFHSFLLYIFYKVIGAVKYQYKTTLYYLSFIIPLITLLGLLIR